MSKRNSIVKIVDGKVVFSEEVLNYFENLRNEENSEWIDKYFNVLSDVSNLDSEKYHMHHIRPCNTFKDETHKNRKQTESLANKFNGNLIKLSIYNHIKAHYFLWKIFDNKDSKHAIQEMCGLKVYLDNLSEDEINEIALLKEQCAKKNKTREEHLEDLRKYRKEHKEERKQYKKKYNEENKDKKLKWGANYRKKHAKEIAKYKKENKERFNKQTKEHNEQKCYDPKENDICTLSALQKRKRKHADKYKDIIPTDCIFKSEDEYLQKQKELDNEEKERIKFEEKYGKNQCFDSKEINICILRTLQDRKRKYLEKYKDINPRDCIIKSEEEYLQKKLECEKHELEVKKHRKNVQYNIRKIIIEITKSNNLKIAKDVMKSIKKNFKRKIKNMQKLIKKKFQHINENLMLGCVMTQKKTIIVL